MGLGEFIELMFSGGREPALDHTTLQGCDYVRLDGEIGPELVKGGNRYLVHGLNPEDLRPNAKVRLGYVEPCRDDVPPEGYHFYSYLLEMQTSERSSQH